MGLQPSFLEDGATVPDQAEFLIDDGSGLRVVNAQYLDDEAVRTDANVLTQYFANFEGAFEGDVCQLRRDYFVLMAWLYFSPFICDMRSLALLRDTDVIRYPLFAIVFGKAHCGKASLVDTLMTSMFGKAVPVDKRYFTTARLRGLQHAYRRFPVFFDGHRPASVQSIRQGHY